MAAIVSVVSGLVWFVLPDQRASWETLGGAHRIFPLQSLGGHRFVASEKAFVQVTLDLTTTVQTVGSDGNKTLDALSYQLDSVRSSAVIQSENWTMSRLCHGQHDPHECGTNYSIFDCDHPEVGLTAKKLCPAMCFYCVETKYGMPVLGPGYILSDAHNHPTNRSFGGWGTFDGESISTFSVLPRMSHGCRKIQKERVHPGGLGASMMGLVWTARNIWLESGVDHFIDARTWSYRCRDSADAWECFFKPRLPCPDPEGERYVDMYEQLPKRHQRISYFNITEIGEASLLNMKFHHEVRVSKIFAKDAASSFAQEMRNLESTAAAKLHGIKGLEIVRGFAQELLQLSPRIEQHIRNRARELLGPLLDQPFVSIHFRRGDKLRETYKKKVATASLPAIVLSKMVEREGTFDWVFVMTDDAAALDELVAARPDLIIRSFVLPMAAGFNECVLPSVRAIRINACQTRCKNLTEAATGHIKFRTYCFLNPSASDEELISTSSRTVAKESQGDAGLAMLLDVWLATRSAHHASVGCGSNADKLIQALRSGSKANQQTCYLRANPTDTCNISGCSVQRCKVSPDPGGIVGVGCTTQHT
jgi:hypothetical protein